MRRSCFVSLSLAASFFLLVACGSDESSESEEDVSEDVENIDATEPEDVEEDIIEDLEEPELFDEIRITLSNANEQLPVWVQTQGGRPWFSILNSEGTQVYIDASCGNCECGVDECPSCPDEETTTQQLDPGEKIRGSWDGKWYHVEMDPQDGHPCLVENFESIADYKIQFSFSYDEPDENNLLLEGTLSNTIQSFEFGVDSDVSYAAP